MVQDYSISKCTRRCALSQRTLEPSEFYYSVILPKDEDVVRIDIAASAWEAPPEGAIGWWKCRMPTAGAKKLRPAPTGVLLDTLSDLVERPGKESLAYFLALLLVRRRALSEERRVETHGDSSPEDTLAESDLWTLTSAADGRVWNVPVREPTAEQLPELEAELSTLLFTEE